MWNKEELDWLEKNREIIESDNPKDLGKLLGGFPSLDESRVKLKIMITLLRDDGQFYMNVDKEDKKNYSAWLYTNLFSGSVMLSLINKSFILLDPNLNLGRNVENHLKKLLWAYDIPEKFYQAIIDKTTLGESDK